MDIDLFHLLRVVQHELRIGTVWLTLDEEHGGPRLTFVWYPDKEHTMSFVLFERDIIWSRQRMALDEMIHNEAARQVYEYREKIREATRKRLP